MNENKEPTCECGLTLEMHGNGAQGHEFYQIPEPAHQPADQPEKESELEWCVIGEPQLVAIRHGEVVVLGNPPDEPYDSETSFHNCYQMACGSSHVLWRHDTRAHTAPVQPLEREPLHLDSEAELFWERCNGATATNEERVKLLALFAGYINSVYRHKLEAQTKDRHSDLTVPDNDRWDVMLREAEAFVCYPSTMATDADKRVACVVAKFALQILDAALEKRKIAEQLAYESGYKAAEGKIAADITAIRDSGDHKTRCTETTHSQICQIDTYIDKLQKGEALSKITEGEKEKE